MLLKKVKIIILLVLILISSRDVLCSAETTFTVIPNLLLNTQLNYDSNYYYLPEKEISVTTRLVQPGFEIGVETPKSLVALHYTLNAHYYNQKGEDDFYGHTALMLGEMNLTDRLKLDLKDRLFTHGIRPRSTPSAPLLPGKSITRTALSLPCRTILSLSFPSR